MSEESDDAVGPRDEADTADDGRSPDELRIDTAVGGPHDGATVRRRGASLSAADAAVVALHGRNGTASGILALTDSFGTERVAYLAPTAASRDWYPGSLVDPTEDPVDRGTAVTDTDDATRTAHIESALALIDRLVARAAECVGRDRVVLLGFEQGGSLAAEWLSRTPARYGGLICLSGALVSPPASQSVDRGALRADRDAGDGTPVLLSCATDDDRVPAARVRETVALFERLGGDVDCRLHDGSPRTVREADATAARAIVLSAVN